MDQEEDKKNILAWQRKDRHDQNERHASDWGKFQQRLEQYIERYGHATADRLLKSERKKLEAQFDKDNKALDQREDQQWLNHHNGIMFEIPVDQPEKSQEPASRTRQGNTDQRQTEADMTEKKNRILEEAKRKRAERDKNLGIKPPGIDPA